MVDISGKKVGIWGVGIVGKSALQYARRFTHTLGAIDKQMIADTIKNQFSAYPITWYPHEQLDRFLQEHDYIIPSPGIDTRPYQTYTNKFICELDLFSAYQQPVIAVTGSCGKTSIVHILQQLISRAGYSAIAAGNIGLGMLDLLSDNRSFDHTVLELSSFQLEHSRFFAPDVAIITNVQENHLDRHNSFQEYARAKLNILAHQKNSQVAIVPFSLQPFLIKEGFLRPRTIFFAPEKPSPQDITRLSPEHELFFIHNGAIIRLKNGQEQQLCSVALFPACTFIDNWLIIAATLSRLGIPLEKQLFLDLNIPEHRLELLGQYHGITFYNDSKSTIPSATLAAVKAVQTGPIILFLGGISKGIDRTDCIASLAHHVKYILYFGAEAQTLKAIGDRYGIPGYAAPTLEEAFEHALHQRNAGDQFLLSPAGASYDLFANYQERGERFKKLVNTFKDSL